MLIDGVLGGYVFLRFANPLLLSPYTWLPSLSSPSSTSPATSSSSSSNYSSSSDHPPSPSPAALRALLLITKVIQALANGTNLLKFLYLLS